MGSIENPPAGKEIELSPEERALAAKRFMADARATAEGANPTTDGRLIFTLSQVEKAGDEGPNSERDKIALLKKEAEERRRRVLELRGKIEPLKTELQDAAALAKRTAKLLTEQRPQNVGEIRIRNYVLSDGSTLEDVSRLLSSVWMNEKTGRAIPSGSLADEELEALLRREIRRQNDAVAERVESLERTIKSFKEEQRAAEKAATSLSREAERVEFPLRFMHKK